MGAAYYTRLEQAREPFIHLKEAPLGAAGFFLIWIILLSELVALGLGVAGAIQWRRIKVFAFLGIACSLLVYYIAYAQDVVNLLGKVS